MSSLKDVNGKESSKRKHGGRFLTTALIVCITYFILLILGTLLNFKMFEFPVQLVTILASVGTALLGVTVFEKPKNNEQI